MRSLSEVSRASLPFSLGLASGTSALGTIPRLRPLMSPLLRNRELSQVTLGTLGSTLEVWPNSQSPCLPDLKIGWLLGCGNGGGIGERSLSHLLTSRGVTVRIKKKEYPYEWLLPVHRNVQSPSPQQPET